VRRYLITHTFVPVATALALAYLGGCSRPAAAEGPAPAPQPLAQQTADSVVPQRLASPAPPAPTAEIEPVPLALSPALLPPDLILDRPVELPLVADRPLRISHAGPTTRHAIIYLHGMCGDSKGADPWSDQATRYGTLIVVRADEPCLDRPGYKWPKDLDAIAARIDQALKSVQDARNGLLDVEHPSLIGYSQGAYRAEQLIGQFPGRYPRAILGGPPTPPSYDALKTATAVAVLGGELEEHQHMLEGTTDLIAHGLHARFFLLPRVHHGNYGPEGPRVVAQALNFVFDRPAP